MARPPSPSSRSVFKERAFWIGLLGIVGGLLAFAVLFNYAVMPIWTRHDASVSVPDVQGHSASEAESILRRAGLEADYKKSPFNPNLDPDTVVEQVPQAGANAKPGRRVYIYVNESPKALVAVPDVVTLSEGVARPKIRDARLVVGRVEMDSARTPYENTVTRQSPVAGRQVPEGTQITLWISPGVGTERARVPDVTGLTPTEAREQLRKAGFYVDSPRATGERVLWQEPEQGTTLREGEEVRIHTTPRTRGAAPPAERSRSETPRTPTAPAAPPASGGTESTGATEGDEEREEAPTPEGDGR